MIIEFGQFGFEPRGGDMPMLFDTNVTILNGKRFSRFMRFHLISPI